jgi:hypothetical protein
MGEPLRTDQLTALRVVVHDALVTIACEKSKRISEDDHLDDVEKDFVEKLGRVCSAERFTVAGYSDLNDETPLKIIRALYSVKFEKGSSWPLPILGTAGVMQLLPAAGEVANGNNGVQPRAPVRADGVQQPKGRKRASEVCSLLKLKACSGSVSCSWQDCTWNLAMSSAVLQPELS